MILLIDYKIKYLMILLKKIIYNNFNNNNNKTNNNNFKIKEINQNYSLIHVSI